MSYYDDLDSIIEESILWAISAALTHKGYNVTGGEPPNEWRNHISKLTRSGSSYTMERTLDTGEAAGDDALDRALDDTLGRLKEEIFDHYPAVIPPLFDDWRNVELLSDLVGERSKLVDARTWVNITPGADTPGGSGGFSGSQIGKSVENLGTQTGRLQGRAVEAFRDGYVSRVDDAIGNNAVLMVGLEIGMVAQYEVIKAVREDVGGIANSMREAFKASAADAGGVDGATVAIAVFGALAAAVGIVATGGVAAAAAGASTSAGLLNGLRGAQKKKAEVSINGGHPDDVVSDTESKLDDYDTAVREEEQNIADELDTLAGTASSGGRGSGGGAAPIDFDLGSPKLVDKTDADGILDERDGQDEIDLTYRNVRKIVNTTIPAISDCLDEGRQGLRVTSAPFNRPYTVGLGPTGVFSSYDKLQDEVADNLTNLKRNLQWAGETLEIAVQHIGKTDEGVDSQLRRHADRIDDIQAAELRAERERERQENRPPHILPPGGRNIPF